MPDKPRVSRPVLVAPRHVRKLVEDARASFADQIDATRIEIRRLHIFTDPQPATNPIREPNDAELLAAFNNAACELVAELELVLEESERRRIDLRGADSVIAVLLQRTGGEARISGAELEDVIPGATLVSEPYEDGIGGGGGLVFRYVPPVKS